ncbi:SAVMC3_10250 family protein [Streptomyces sp900105245]|uniref:SAVMC3_10250 family protein n=1 Tax=Streptomyces sp. 900105245 TaxID=3154379 RepID=UPI00332C0D41
MSQILYFSEAKASQFVRPKRRLHFREGAFELTIPLIGARFTATATSEGNEITRKIEEIIDSIEHSGRAALWYEDPQVSDGDWVQFESKMAQILVTAGPYRMLFFGPDPLATGSVALLLYGSPRHLLASPPDQNPTDIRDLDSYPTSLARMMQAISEDEQDPVNIRGRSAFELGAMSMADRVYQHAFSFPAVRGYAQVVANINSTDRIHFSPPNREPIRPSRLVVASPLYVEHSTDALPREA